MDHAAFQQSLEIFLQQGSNSLTRFEFADSDRWPCLSDDTSVTDFDPHYVYHTGWAARHLARRAPRLHVDFGSSVHFVSIASAICPIEFYDYRPASLSLDGVKSGIADLLALPFPDNYLESVSCMHVVEHVGLGRYGDAVDYDGDMKAMTELCRVVGKGGNLLFVVPVGRPRICFNAHRIYSFRQIIEFFRSSFFLDEFALVTDHGTFIRNASEQQANAQGYGCGCFLFRKGV
jgi:SAM-dependent methyltransferase